MKNNFFYCKKKKGIFPFDALKIIILHIKTSLSVLTFNAVGKSEKKKQLRVNY